MELTGAENSPPGLRLIKLIHRRAHCTYWSPMQLRALRLTCRLSRIGAGLQWRETVLRKMGEQMLTVVSNGAKRAPGECLL